MSARLESVRFGLGVVALTLLGGAGGAVAATSIGSAQVVDDSLRSRDVKDGTLRPQDLAPATTASLRGATGPPGVRGEEGEKGEAAAASIAQTATLYGPVATIAPNSGVYVFAGAPAVVTTTQTHPRVVGAASVALGYAPGTAEGQADLGMCFRPTSGGPLQNFYGGNFIIHGFSGSRLPYSATAAVVLPAGSYEIGLCVRNNSSKPISNNNFVNGYVQVTQ